MKRMLRTLIAALGILLFTISLFFVGCKKTEIYDSQNDPETDYAGIVSKRFGIPLTSIEDAGENIVVAGDIVFPKSQIISATQKRQVVAGTDNATLSFAGGPISFINREDIKIFINDEAPLASAATKAIFREGISETINNFNTLISGTSIKMREVSAIGDCDIVIRLRDDVEGVLGMAWYPFDGEPGKNVYLSLSDASTPLGKAISVATHELGHALGLFHTDQIPDISLTESHTYNGTPFLFYLKEIPGTPGFATQDIFGLNPDPESFINELSANNTWTQSVTNPTGVGFSDFDKAAIRFLYPKFEIIGSSSFCNTATYSVSNLPIIGATVSWSLSNPALASITSSGSEITLTRTGYGSANLTATISLSGGNVIVTKSIDFGYPTPEITTTYDGSATLGGCYFFSYQNHRPGTTYKWILTKFPGGSPQLLSTSANVEICLEEFGRFNLALLITNDCVADKNVYGTGFVVVDDDGPIH